MGGTCRRVGSCALQKDHTPFPFPFPSQPTCCAHHCGRFASSLTAGKFDSVLRESSLHSLYSSLVTFYPLFFFLCIRLYPRLAYAVHTADVGIASSLPPDMERALYPEHAWTCSMQMGIFTPTVHRISTGASARVHQLGVHPSALARRSYAVGI